MKRVLLFVILVLMVVACDGTQSLRVEPHLCPPLDSLKAWAQRDTFDLLCYLAFPPQTP